LIVGMERSARRHGLSATMGTTNPRVLDDANDLMDTTSLWLPDNAHDWWHEGRACVDVALVWSWKGFIDRQPLGDRRVFLGRRFKKVWKF